MLIVALLIASVSALDNGLGLTPQMGWSTWIPYGSKLNATVIEANAAALHQTGLAALGYQYVIIDEFWALP
jgi:alpha-galactosidase